MVYLKNPSSWCAINSMAGNIHWHSCVKCTISTFKWLTDSSYTINVFCISTFSNVKIFNNLSNLWVYLWLYKAHFYNMSQRALGSCEDYVFLNMCLLMKSSVLGCIQFVDWNGLTWNCSYILLNRTWVIFVSDGITPKEVVSSYMLLWCMQNTPHCDLTLQQQRFLSRAGTQLTQLWHSQSFPAATVIETQQKNNAFLSWLSWGMGPEHLKAVYCFNCLQQALLITLLQTLLETAIHITHTHTCLTSE